MSLTSGCRGVRSQGRGLARCLGVTLHLFVLPLRILFLGTTLLYFRLRRPNLGPTMITSIMGRCPPSHLGEGLCDAIYALRCAGKTRELRDDVPREAPGSKAVDGEHECVLELRMRMRL